MHRPLPHHLPALDGLRGAAALIVLATHSANAGFLPAALRTDFGLLGVVLFYLLSGFLMMHYAVRRPLERANLRDYAVARAARVLPLFYLALLAAVLVWLASGEYPYNIRTAERLLGNALLLRGTGVLWSVPVELHFYALFPLLWWAQARGLFAVAALAVLAGCALLAWWVPAPSVTALPFWLHFFAIGAGLRWLLDDGARSRLDWRLDGPAARVAGWLLFAALALLPPDHRSALGLPVFDPRLDPVGWLFLPLVLWFACAQHGPFALFATPQLRWLGAVSFGVYLIHSPVVSVVQTFRIGAAWGPLAQFAVVLAATVLAATLAHYFYERPVQRWLRRRLLSPSIAAQP